MTTPEAPPEAVPYKIVVCGTCNVVFMVHPGRPSCPSCGGDPFMILYEGELPTSSEDQAAPAEAETPAPAEATADEPAVDEPSEVRPHFDEVERQAQEAAETARQAAASTGLQ